MIPLGALGMLGAAPVTPVSLTYVAFTSAGVQGNPYTFTSHAIGTASAGRYVVVSVSVSNVIAPASVTVAGQATTRVNLIASPSSRSTALFVTDSPVTTGTTADIAVTMGGTRDVEIAVFTLENAATPTSPDYTNTDIQTSTDTLTLDVNVDEGGAVLAQGVWDTASVTPTWSGVTLRATNSSANYHAIYGSAEGLSAETPRAVSTSSVNSNGGALSVSWSPA
jgi:hypothetical protein